MGELTKPQVKALEWLKSGPGSAYGMQVSLNTLNALALKGLVIFPSQLGAIAFPRSARWLITEAGRRALLRAKEAGKPGGD